MMMDSTTTSAAASESNTDIITSAFHETNQQENSSSSQKIATTIQVPTIPDDEQTKGPPNTPVSSSHKKFITHEPVSPDSALPPNPDDLRDSKPAQNAHESSNVSPFMATSNDSSASATTTTGTNSASATTNTKDDRFGTSVPVRQIPLNVLKGEVSFMDFMDKLFDETKDFGGCRLQPHPDWNPIDYPPEKFSSFATRLDAYKSKYPKLSSQLIKHPIRQEPKGSRGFYSFLLMEQDDMTFKDFEKLAAEEDRKERAILSARKRRALRNSQDDTPNAANNAQSTADKIAEKEFLEADYWKRILHHTPLYGADLSGSLFDQNVKNWNLNDLGSVLDIVSKDIQGVTSSYLYFGMHRSTFAWHIEDMNLPAINYNHFGAGKQWYVIPEWAHTHFEDFCRQKLKDNFKKCDEFLRHKTTLVSPDLLRKSGVPVYSALQNEGEFMVVWPVAYHCGFNTGFNCAEAVNFAFPSWIPYGDKANYCKCTFDSVKFDMKWFKYAYDQIQNGEATLDDFKAIRTMINNGGMNMLENAPAVGRCSKETCSMKSSRKPSSHNKSTTEKQSGKRKRGRPRKAKTSDSIAPVPTPTETSVKENGQTATDSGSVQLHSSSSSVTAMEDVAPQDSAAEDGNQSVGESNGSSSNAGGGNDDTTNDSGQSNEDGGDDQMPDAPDQNADGGNGGDNNDDDDKNDKDPTFNPAQVEEAEEEEKKSKKRKRSKSTGKSPHAKKKKREPRGERPCSIAGCDREGNRSVTSLRNKYTFKDDASGKVCDRHYFSDRRHFMRGTDPNQPTPKKPKKVRPKKEKKPKKSPKPKVSTRGGTQVAATAQELIRAGAAAQAAKRGGYSQNGPQIASATSNQLLVDDNDLTNKLRYSQLVQSAPLNFTTPIMCKDQVWQAIASGADPTPFFFPSVPQQGVGMNYAQQQQGYQVPYQQQPQQQQQLPQQYHQQQQYAQHPNTTGAAVSGTYQNQANIHPPQQQYQQFVQQQQQVPQQQYAQHQFSMPYQQPAQYVQQQYSVASNPPQAFSNQGGPM